MEFTPVGARLHPASYFLTFYIRNKFHRKHRSAAPYAIQLAPISQDLCYLLDTWIQKWNAFEPEGARGTFFDRRRFP